MIEPIKQIVEVITTNSKTSSFFLICIAKFNNLWIEWGNPFFSFLTTVAGFILLVILACYHFQNLKKITRENENDK